MSNRKETPDVLGAVLGGSPALDLAVSAPEAVRPREWEYREVIFRDYRGWRTRSVNGRELGDWKSSPLLVDYMEQAGKEGWELVSMSDRHNNQKEAYFKRPKA